jgi:hypothetical protein
VDQGVAPFEKPHVTGYNDDRSSRKYSTPTAGFFATVGANAVHD